MDFGKIIKSVIGTVAPFLTAALPGPLGGLAKGVLSGVLGLEGDDAKDEDKLAAAVQNITADQLLAIKTAEQNFQLQMKELGFRNVESLEKIAADDRASARNREIAVKDKTPMILAYLYAFGFFATLGGEIWISISHVAIDPLAAKSIDILLGVLVGMVLGTKEYYFGSSSGSRAKDTVISNMAKDTQ